MSRDKVFFRPRYVFMIAASCAALITLTMVTGDDVSAQGRDLDRRIDRIERQLRALQRRVFGTEGEPAAPLPDAPAATGSGAADTRRLLADLAVQVGAVERQMRDLTGRLEKLEFDQRRVSNALSRTEQAVMALRTTAPPAGDAEPDAASGTAAGTTAASPPTAAPAVPENAPVALPDGNMEARYQYAFGFVRSNDLDRAQKALGLFLEAHPTGELTGNAKYWMGRVELRQGRPAQAARHLLSVIDDHPDHEKRGDALAELADALIQLDSNTEACDALAEFRRIGDNVSPRLQARARRLGETAGCRT